MKLYEINEEIRDLAEQLTPDEETGELPINYEELMNQFLAMQLKRTEILEYLAKIVLETRSEVSALKDEESRLKIRRNRLSLKEDRLMEILDRECAGIKTNLGVATLCYRKTSKVSVEDEKEAIKWLSENGHKDCYRVLDPEISKTEVKKLLQEGVEVPGAHIEEGLSVSLR